MPFGPCRFPKCSCHRALQLGAGDVSIRVAMRRWGNAVVATLAGLAAGTVVLGIGGRVAMRIIALATGQVPGFSLGGTLEVLVAGAWRGTIGGLVYLVLGRFVPAKGPWKGLALGILLFLIVVATLRPSIRQQVATLGVVPLAVGLFGLLFIVYGIAVDFSVGRLATRRKETV